MRALAALLRRSAGQSWHLLAAASLIFAGFQVLMVAAATALIETRADSIFTQLVPAFLRGFGSDIVHVASFEGLISFGYFHPVIVILLSVLAMYYASEPAHEVEAGLVDVVLARPVSRHRLLTRSVAMTLVVPAALVSMMALGTFVGLWLMGPPRAEPPTSRELARLIVLLVSVAWCLGALALAVTAVARRWTVAFGTAAFAAVALYLVDFLAMSWPVWRKIAWISPFHYYPALRVIAGRETVAPNLVVLLSTTIVLIAFAYWRFARRDV